jgi:hypothetical protein
MRNGTILLKILGVIAWTAGCSGGGGDSPDAAELAGDHDADAVENVQTDPVADPGAEPADDPVQEVDTVEADDAAAEAGGCGRDFGSVFATEQEVFRGENGGSAFWLFYATVEGTMALPPFDYFSLELWPVLGGPSSPGTYAFTDANYNSCGTCGLIGTGCTDSSGGRFLCEKTFLVTAGTVVIDGIGAVGSTFMGSVSGLAAIEVRIDPDDFESIPVPGGETACIEDLPFAATVAQVPGG